MSDATPVISEETQLLVDELNASFAAADLPERLKLLRRAVSGHVVFTTSLGIEDQALTHAIAESQVAFDVVTLDTGRLFPETYAVWQETEEKYGLRIKPFAPNTQAVEALVADQGVNANLQWTQAGARTQVTLEVVVDDDDAGLDQHLAHRDVQRRDQAADVAQALGRVQDGTVHGQAAGRIQAGHCRSRHRSSS